MTRKRLVLALAALVLAGIAAASIWGIPDSGLLGRAGIKPR
jgi:hypothetical protein